MPELQRWAFYPGAWDVTLETRLGPQGPWETTRGTAQIGTELSGCLFDERLQTTQQGKPFSAVTVVTWDHQSSRWQLTWTDSGHGMQLLYDGTATSDGVDFRMTRVVGGRTLTLRRRFTFDGPRAFAWESARSADGGATWDVTGRARYTKRDAPR